ncbi:MAG: hypothetical protein CME85_14575 [Henriciella sp.]|jgi:hypothetical protein|uniref:DUF4168 domain-containing protein n=1 Tax=Henriciella sp. TaxID=1968823 RepID=UPI000C11DC6D|nr:DUF4168 domain-containing protein [Henriciella sp.]MAN72952.1 hypothetical protein [Henriciella sp.]MBF34771.1 hypothetical protein [Hyphomonadaceae bacterium]MBK76692.1 hypothetical protein [Henriciella sp.]PHR82188.1 MAG: hypothetical protein COA64_01945 [Henriciella sp.]|tara:strand:- start:930 stop:1322 length:393 start_codon:yes stop_codon:yes gene_type:complete
MALKTFRTTATAAIAAATLFAGGAAVAQQSVPQEAQPQQAQPQIEPVTDAEISQFVAANEAVSEIAAEVTPQLKAASDEAAAKELQADAQEQMIAAINEEGLSADRFTQIAQMAQMDAELATKLRAEMNS